MDMIGLAVEEEDHLVEDVERVRELLANAPADRAWRRRGYLVLCRAHPDRVQQNQVMISRTPIIPALSRRTCSSSVLPRAGGIAGDSGVDERYRWQLDGCGVDGAFVLGGGHVSEDRGPVKPVRRRTRSNGHAITPRPTT